MGRLACALLLLLSMAACGQPARLEVTNVWMRDTVGGTANAAIFMTIASPAADRLVGASTPVARRTDLMTMAGGSEAMAMTYLQAIDIPAGEPVSLDPTGLHVWLEGLAEPLAAGRTFPLRLQFEQAGEREVTVTVIGAAEPPPASGSNG